MITDIDYMDVCRSVLVSVVFHCTRCANWVNVTLEDPLIGYDSMMLKCPRRCFILF